MMTSHNMCMMIISATEFKAKCLELMDTVNRTGETIQITKRGKVVAELNAPTGEPKKYFGPGFAKGTIEIVGDIMAPYDVEWNVLKDEENWDPTKNGY
jgi:antitoxin (DNA-binding transcriptional repressor) of toxin-antitoxin stability system